MIAYTLSKLFPPKASKLGKVENIDAIVRLRALVKGDLKVEKPEPPEAGVIAVYEWRYGKEFPPKRIR